MTDLTKLNGMISDLNATHLTIDGKCEDVFPYWCEPKGPHPLPEMYAWIRATVTPCHGMLCAGRLWTHKQGRSSKLWDVLFVEENRTMELALVQHDMLFRLTYLQSGAEFRFLLPEDAVLFQIAFP